ncbi:uncharacterized protein LOC122996129 [Thunnus albacares]|uniref:uncharacterized protein LOC122996129 n=1 Tax=Thunnus albacares TaxID=8236 RepID=UPI001CF673E8|nr:uncharacterized protein LOC122996129 [Thunnus albacares]
MESELEKLQLEIKGALYKLTVEQLIKVCDALQISGPGKEHVTGKTRSQLVSHVIRYLEQEELANLEDEGMSELLNAQDIIDKIKMDKEHSASELLNQTEEQESLQKEVEVLRLSLREKESAMHDLMKNSMNLPLSSSIPVKNMASALPNGSMWHKEFKISGQIGEPGQKDRLTFSSLARQIENGLSKGYPDSEITDAVIRAITPGLQLRSYLEGKENLTLPALRRILRSHYQERSATELYKQLTSEVQSSKETPQNFLIRAMDLRQKILFASQEVESSLKYDPALVQSLFMHTVLTGLQNDNIKSDLQPYLLQTNTSDELLLEKVNIACANEKERQDKKKHSAPSRVTHVNTVQPSESPVEKKSTTQQSTATLPPDLLSEMKEMRSDMALLKDLRAEVAQIRETIQKSAPATPQPSSFKAEQNCMQFYHQQPPATVQEYRPALGPGHVRETAQFQQRFAPQRYYPAPRPRPRCFACIQAGEDYCQHCFRCGSSEHFRAGCKAQRLTKPAREIPLN